jgi:hypothetical protein
LKPHPPYRPWSKWEEPDYRQHLARRVVLAGTAAAIGVVVAHDPEVINAYLVGLTAYLALDRFLA